MNDRKYIFYVECTIGRHTWLDKFLIICANADRILPILLDAGFDDKDAYGKPKEQLIQIHHIQRFAHCRDRDAPESLVQMYTMYCDIKPNGQFL